MSLREDVDLLLRVPLFESVDPVRLEVLAFSAERITFSTGDALVQAGAVQSAALLLMSGSAVMMAEGADGAPAIGRLDAGDVIGETALMTPGPAKINVRAASDGAYLKISHELFERLLAEFPEIGDGMVRGARGRLSDLADDLGKLAARFPAQTSKPIS